MKTQVLAFLWVIAAFCKAEASWKTSTNPFEGPGSISIEKMQELYQFEMRRFTACPYLLQGQHVGTELKATFPEYFDNERIRNQFFLVEVQTPSKKYAVVYCLEKDKRTNRVSSYHYYCGDMTNTQELLISPRLYTDIFRNIAERYPESKVVNILRGSNMVFMKPLLEKDSYKEIQIEFFDAKELEEVGSPFLCSAEKFKVGLVECATGGTDFGVEWLTASLGKKDTQSTLSNLKKLEEKKQ